MRILLLGGTAWVGATIARSALSAGHQVTCVARRKVVPAGAELVRANRDHHDGLLQLRGGNWDVVIDLATQPAHVEHSVLDLEPFAAHYLFISSCNVYCSLAEIGIEEDSALNPPLAGATMNSAKEYGSAKVACEKTVMRRFGAERTTIVRPGLIGGPADPTSRTSYWPLRFARPSNPQGRILVPNAPNQPAAIIDVRDLSTWIIRLAENRTAGVFNATGQSTPLFDHLKTAQAVAGHRGSFALADPEWLAGHSVGSWSGPRSLPLWIDDPSAYGIGALSNARAVAAGLEIRALAETFTDILAWGSSQQIATAAGAGLTDDEEAFLLNQLGPQ